ncbi:hypothetical protein JST97_12355 [bacterium]|nr:hypothetical protein [bacterium]
MIRSSLHSKSTLPASGRVRPPAPETPNASERSLGTTGFSALALGGLGLVQLCSPAQAQTPANVALGTPLSEQWSVQLSGWQTREWTATDNRGNWTEYQRGQRHHFQRSYQEDGSDWVEAVEGQNHWRNREGGYEGLAAEAESKGSSQISLPGSEPIQVFGAPTPQELGWIKQALDDLPTEFRPYAQKLYLSHHLGEVIDPEGKVKLARGMSGNREGGIVLDRDYMAEPGMELRVTKNLLAHESGHNLDRISGASHGQVWSQPGSVSEYGARNSSEDFAETHRFVLENWAAYQRPEGLPEGTEVQGTRLLPDHAPPPEKARDILRLYGQNR